MKSINPTTGQEIQSYSEFPPQALDAICQEAQQAFEGWRKISFKDRAVKMKRAGEVLLKNKEHYARLMALEMGKPLRQGRSEIEKCAWGCKFYAQEAERYLSKEIIKTDAAQSFVCFEPLGIVLAVMPWNFPFWQVFRCAAPTLMAGNVILLKHASNVCGCALAIEEIFKEAGFPRGVFRTVLIRGELVKDLIKYPLVQAVTLTGSTQAGQSIASQAGQHIKKTVLELGGSDPYIILEDADLERAAQTCAASRMINAGQSCIAAKRFIVIESVFEEFQKKFVAKIAAQSMGSPLDESVTLGPLARHDLRDQLHTQVLESQEKGAEIVLGGEIPSGPGAFYPPTVLSDIHAGMPAYEEELFGPVASLIKARDEQDAIRIANDTIFGLGAAIFTQDIQRGERIAREEIQAGCCFINDFVRSDPRLPFGGMKQSGYGRELSSFGIREFVNIKTVYIK